jgi:hypothetical protein
MEQILNTNRAGSTPLPATLPQEPSQTQTATGSGLNGIPTTSTVSDHPNAPLAASVSSLSCLPYFIQSIVSWIVWIFTFGCCDLSSSSTTPQTTNTQATETPNNIQPNPPPEPVQTPPTITLPLGKDSLALYLIQVLRYRGIDQLYNLGAFSFGDTDDYDSFDTFTSQLKANPTGTILTDTNPKLIAYACLKLLHERKPQIITGMNFIQLAAVVEETNQTASSIPIDKLMEIIKKMANEDSLLLKEIVNLFGEFSAHSDDPAATIKNLVNMSFNSIVCPVKLSELFKNNFAGNTPEKVSHEVRAARENTMEENENYVRKALRLIVLKRAEIFAPTS